jgi:hypothetical protein
LIKALNHQQRGLIKGDITLHKFSANTQSLVQSSKQSSLTSMRGFEGILWEILNIVVCIGTLMVTGRFAIFGRTNSSITKVNEIAEELQQAQQAISVK